MKLRQCMHTYYPSTAVVIVLKGHWFYPIASLVYMHYIIITLLLSAIGQTVVHQLDFTCMQ